MINRTDAPEINQQLANLKSDLQKAREYIAQLEAVQEVAQSLTSELNLTPLLHKILSAAVKVTEAAAGSLLLLDPQTSELVFAVVEGGGGTSLEGVRIASDAGIAGWVATNRQPLIVDDVNKDNRHYSSIAKAFDFKLTSILCVPMIVHNKLIGVLQLLQDVPGRYFGKMEQDLLTTFASQAAISIENARLYEGLKAEQDKLVAVEHEVRKQLAGDLHDGPTQFVSSIILNLNFVKILLERAPENVPSEINKTISLAETTLKQLRTLLFDLRPVILETQGLVAALKVYSKRLKVTEGLNINLKINNGFDQLSSKADISVYAIVQEAVNNAKKYAEAESISVTLTPNQQKDTLTVSIVDNGIGFDVEKVWAKYDQKDSLGMLNMQERADRINGTLKVNSKVGQGTEVCLTLPLTENLLYNAQNNDTN